jgi:SAM-dependent methyltransferase
MSTGAWGGGYVTDIPYPPRFHPAQSQSMMALAAILNNFSAQLAPGRKDFHFADFGCGSGTTALITAAANPAWRVTGLDFNPAHIAEARETARAAGIANAQFLEADLAGFAGREAARALPDFDAATMHGVWSWVSPAVQDGILRLLDQKLAPGGLCHVSYNLLTGWQGAIALQRLVREAGLRAEGPSDRQAACGFAVARALAVAGNVSFSEGAGRAVLEQLPGKSPAYLAHEMMNAHWRPVLHAEVAARLADAKLQFAGCPALINNVPELIFSPEQRAILAQFGGAEMTELFKDICQPVMLRHDVFIRGGARLRLPARDEILAGVTLCLAADEAAWRFKFPAGNGVAEMREEFYRPVLARLQAGPATLRELAALPDLRGQRDNFAELIAVAIGTGHAAALPNPGAKLDEPCRRLNAILLQRHLAAGRDEPVPLAAPALGGGVILPAGQALQTVAAAAEGAEAAGLLRHFGFTM